MPLRKLENIALLNGMAIQGYAEDRTVVYWNAASETLYKYSAEEALGRKLEELIIPEPARDMVIAEVQRWVDGGPPPTAGHLDLVDKTGQIVSVLSNHISIEDETGARTLYCLDVPIAAHDRAFENPTSPSTDAADGTAAIEPVAERNGRAPFQSQLLSSLSHELRTPMNAILGFSDLIALRVRQLDNDPKCQEYAQNVRVAATHLVRAVEQALVLFGVSALRVEPDPMPVRLNDIFISVAHMILADDPGREDLLTFRPDPDLTVSTDPFIFSNALAALTNLMLDLRVGTDPVRIRAEPMRGFANRVFVIAEGRGRMIDDMTRLQLIGGDDLRLDTHHAGNQSQQFQLSVLQRCSAALGIVLNLDRTPDGVNRFVLQLPA